MYDHALKLSLLLVSTFIGIALWGETNEYPIRLKATSHVLHLPAPLLGMALNPQEKKLFTFLDNKTALILNLDNQHQLIRLGDKGTDFNAAVWNTHKNALITASRENTISIRDTKAGTEKRILQGHLKEVTSLAVNADGTKILTGSRDGTARLWDFDTGKELMLIGDSVKPLELVAWSPNEKYCATASLYTVKVWDLETGQEIAKYKEYSNNILSLAFSLQGELLMGLTNGTIRCETLDSFRTALYLEGHSNGVSSLAFSSDGKLVFTGSSDKTVRLWDTETGRELALLELPAKVVSLAFSPHDSSLFIGLDNQTIERWSVPL